MRIAAAIALLILSCTTNAASVAGFCERDGKRLDFTDGIAFADARESEKVTTTFYLTAKPLDRAALAACAECSDKLPENTFLSPRGDLIETQKQAIADGWVEFVHIGGDLDMTTIVNIMYVAEDGTHTGLDGGNGRISFDTRSDTHATGRVTTEARGAPFNETDMNCDITFDLAVGWPK